MVNSCVGSQKKQCLQCVYRDFVPDTSIGFLLIAVSACAKPLENFVIVRVIWHLRCWSAVACAKLIAEHLVK